MTATNGKTTAQRLLRLWPAVYILVVAGILFAWFADWAYDDPFITYRYAQNLTRGIGFVYNPGQRVQSTTTPLFTLLLAALSLLWNDIPRMANLVGALSLAAGALSLWDLARTWKTPSVGIAALLLYPTFPLLLTTLGSETPLYLALCLAAFAFYARGKYFATAIFCALAVLTRPDGVLVPAVIGLDYLLRVRRPIPWKPISVFMVLTLPWFIFAWLYFGSPIPATLAAKQGQGSMAISESFAPGLLTIARPYLTEWQYRIETILAVIGFMFLAWKSRVDRRVRRWWVFLAWAATYFIAFSLLGVSRYFWYYAPLVPGFVVLVGIGASGTIAIAFALTRYLTQRSLGDQLSTDAISKPLGTFLVFALLASLAVFQILNLNRLRQGQNGRYSIYHDVGIWLGANTPVNASVGTLEVGIIGYFAQRPMLGFAGLVEPAIAEQLAENTTYTDTALWTIENLHPPYLVLHEGVFPAIEDILARENCQVVERFPAERYGYQHNINVFACGY